MKSTLVEYMPFTFRKVLNEGKGGGPLIVEGVIQRAGAKNQNGRVYPKDILSREIENYKSSPTNEQLSSWDWKTFKRSR